MSTLVSSPSNETDPEGRLQRVQALRDNQLFQSLFYAKIIERENKTSVSILSNSTPEEKIHDLRVEYAVLDWIIDILDSEERAAKDAAEQKKHQRK